MFIWYVPDGLKHIAIDGLPPNCLLVIGKGNHQDQITRIDTAAAMAGGHQVNPEVLFNNQEAQKFQPQQSREQKKHQPAASPVSSAQESGIDVVGSQQPYFAPHHYQPPHPHPYPWHHTQFQNQRATQRANRERVHTPSPAPYVSPRTKPNNHGSHTVARLLADQRSKANITRPTVGELAREYEALNRKYVEAVIRQQAELKESLKAKQELLQQQQIQLDLQHVQQMEEKHEKMQQRRHEMQMELQNAAGPSKASYEPQENVQCNLDVPEKMTQQNEVQFVPIAASESSDSGELHPSDKNNH